MSDDFCPRQIVFYLPGNPSVKVTATEDNGEILFKVDVQGNADLRAFYFDVADTKEAGLTISDAGPMLTEWRAGHGSILDLGDGATLAGAVKTGFDLGLEWGTPGSKKDHIDYEVTFTLSNAAGDLTLDDIAFQRFGAKLDSVGAGSKGGTQSSKLLGVAPAAPDAVDDVYNIFEDGAANANSPSKTPTAVVIDVLANDTDADTPHDQLTITAIHDGPSHGTVTISADGKTMTYTPDLDWSGTDTFEYCISDGAGGQDHATVTINVEAVADDPIINWTIAQGNSINQILLTVTATQNDADGSEYIDDITATVLAGLPAGAFVDPSFIDPLDQLGEYTQVFVIDTAAMTDYNFNLDFTATAVELSNGDTEDHTETQSIVIDYNENFATLDYTVTDQSIWSTGDEFVYDYDDFLGIDESVGGFIGDDVVTGTFASASASIKAGFDVFLHFEGGQIDAEVPVDVTVNTTYNKTTDAVYIESALALGSGGSFTTTGPEGKFLLDFIFEVAAQAHISLLWVDLFNDGFDENWNENIFDIDSSDPAAVYTLLGGLVDIGFEWPHISVTNDPGTMEGTGESNNFLFATLDIDALANLLLGGALSFLDADPNDPDNFELLDLDLTGGLNFIQQFALGVAQTSVSLKLEDGFEVAMTLGSPLMITNASSHDLNGDGIIGFEFALGPNLTLHNETSLGGNIAAELWIPKNFELSLVHENYDIASGPLVTVYEDTFTLDTDALVAQTVVFTV